MAVFGGWRLTRTGILFVVGIIVLGGLVTGGIFLVKNHGEAVRHDQAVKIAEQNLKDHSQIATQPVNAPTASEPGTKSTDTPPTKATPSPDAVPSATGSPSSQLPVTGIDTFQVITSSTILAILAFSVVSYVASRRVADHL
jgi:hypothetical protein